MICAQIVLSLAMMPNQAMALLLAAMLPPMLLRIPAPQMKITLVMIFKRWFLRMTQEMERNRTFVCYW